MNGIKATFIRDVQNDYFFRAAGFEPFDEPERFDRHIEKLKRRGENIDYVSICSPNYLHDAHIRFGLRHGADVICEKPLVLNPWNFQGLADFEKETGKKVYNILQVRLHPSIQALRKKIQEGPAGHIYDITLTYITSRGRWYHYSWKGNEQKSGGITTNIGIHFFDMLIWIFGDLKENITNLLQYDKASGYIELENARIRWYLSLDKNDLPEKVKGNGHRTHRSIIIDGEEFEFSDGFADLHTLTYTKILAGEGFRLEESKKSIETVYTIRNARPVGLKGSYHPMLKNLKPGK